MDHSDAVVLKILPTADVEVTYNYEAFRQLGTSHMRIPTVRRVSLCLVGRCCSRKRPTGCDQREDRNQCFHGRITSILVINWYRIASLLVGQYRIAAIRHSDAMVPKTPPMADTEVTDDPQQLAAIKLG
ncbi:hypothetical protein PUNSTDRAFT_122130 [Punctularia strigosozonata HHB-11173 SS5]|uniref:uncharacterized protein n=1 Tax=Punctularia strigosozonata (strain HHB-11173) TaxID=741275 RepID=UPI00044175B4|nr:uncharacterized protein PUNSTDRAFT_122130 [Punctularia strigosozonata HHB-11173 SS5]EIN06336.1 hypothetical protein PUNSTDRAFT_122130 [Punctularia strigosozonata HHB-11173 SS5]